MSGFYVSNTSISLLKIKSAHQTTKNILFHKWKVEKRKEVKCQGASHKHRIIYDEFIGSVVKAPHSF